MNTENTTPAPDVRGGWTSASNAEADSLCPGRHRAQIGLPEEVSDAAASGNRVHAALASSKTDGLSVEEQEMVQACSDTEKAALVKVFGAAVANMKLNPIRERRFWIEIGSYKHSGQPDAVHRKGSVLFITDYKTGRDEVASSPRNEQLRDLAVLAWKNLPLVDKVATCVVQPWVTRDPDVCLYNSHDLQQALTLMAIRVQAANKEGSPRVAGEKQCKYCRAKHGHCPVYAAWAAKPLAVAVRIEDVALVPVKDWTPDQRSSFCERMDEAQKWLDDCKSQLKELLKSSPDAVPGFTLRPGQNREKIIDPQKVFDGFSKEGGTLEAFMACTAVAKGTLREQLGKATGKRGKALDELLKSLLVDAVETTTTEPSIVKAG